MSGLFILPESITLRQGNYDGGASILGITWDLGIAVYPKESL